MSAAAVYSSSLCRELIAAGRNLLRVFADVAYPLSELVCGLVRFGLFGRFWLFSPALLAKMLPTLPFVAEIAMAGVLAATCPLLLLCPLVVIQKEREWVSSPRRLRLE